MALTLDGTNGIVSSGSITTQSANGVIFSDSSNQGAAASPFGLKNRIINGDMVIDQRNAGASVTQTTTPLYTVDRWFCYGTSGSKFTVQQNAGSVTPPAGYTKYLGVTSSSAYSVGSGDALGIGQLIEGLNVADLAWGTANAKTVTISFWVRSSLTGSFGGALQNAASNRSYPFTYTISSANTWEQKSITVAGDTTGTWLTTNGIGLQLLITMGAGSTYSGTAGAWAGSNLWQPTGSTSVVGTNGATFYITGVQLERNTTATPFEWIPYTTELQLCQRYYWKWQGDKFLVTARETNSWWGNFIYPVTMRVAPTLSSSFTTFAATGPSNFGQLSVYGNGWKTASGSPATLLDGVDIWDAQVYITGFAGTYSDSASIIASSFTFFSFSAEL